MRCFSVLFIILVVSLLGCKTERLKNPDAQSTDPQKPYPSGLVLEGIVGLGSISGAEVTVHAFSGGSVNWQSSIGSGQTGEEGSYSIDIDDKFLDTPAVVKVIGRPNLSTLRCGLSIGCGSGVSFGDTFQLQDTLELFLVVPRLQKRSFVNPSILSHLAFKHFERTGDTEMSAETISYHIERSNSIVASRFGISDSIVNLAQLDPTLLPISFEFEELRASVLSTAVLQSMQKKQNIEGIVGALEQFTDQYLEVGLPDVGSDQEDAIALIDILQEASNIIRAAQQSHGFNLNGLITQLDSRISMLSLAGGDEYLAGDASVTAGLTGVEKGKSLVGDVRTFASSVDLKKLAGLSNLSQFLSDGASNILNLFNVAPESTDLLADEDVDHALSSLGFVAEAALFSIAEYYANSVVLTSYKDVDFQHSIVQGHHIFNFHAPYDSCAGAESSCPALMNINLIIRVTRFTGNAGTKTFAPDALDVGISGAVDVGNISLGFPQNDFQLRSIKPSISISDYVEDVWSGDDYRLSADAFRIRLPFKISRLAVSGLQGDYQGFLSLDLGRFSIQYTDRSIHDGQNLESSKVVNEDIWRINNMEGLKVGFVGQPQEDLASAINVNQAGILISDSFLIKSSSISCGNNSVDCEEKSGFHVEGETEEAFLSLNASATYKARLKGLTVPAIVQLNVSRNTLSDNAIDNILVSYPGHGFRLAGRFNNNGGMSALNATNLDGTLLYFDTVGGKRIGVVDSPYGEKVADIVDMGQWVKIRYINGDFESF